MRFHALARHANFVLSGISQIVPKFSKAFQSHLKKENLLEPLQSQQAPIKKITITSTNKQTAPWQTLFGYSNSGPKSKDCKRF